MRACRSKKNNSGFSFIEAIFAMVILSFGFVGIMSLYASMTGNTENDEIKLVASKLAGEKIEQTLSNKATLGYSSINTGLTTDQISYDNYNFQRQTNIDFVDSGDLKTVSASDTGFKRIDVTVNWNDQNISVMSLISNH